MKKSKAACEEAFMITVEPGKYSWCSCGHSEKMPFCDGAHKTADTDRKSIKEVVTESRQVVWCGCNKSGTMPFCDGSQVDSSTVIIHDKKKH